MPKGVEHWDWDVDAGGFRYGVESLMPKGVEHAVNYSAKFSIGGVESLMPKGVVIVKEFEEFL